MMAGTTPRVDFEIVHRQAKQHVNADTLSRLPCYQCGRENHNTALIATAPLIPRGHCVDVRRGGRYFGIVSYFRYLHYTEWLNMDRLGISKNRVFRY